MIKLAPRFSTTFHRNLASQAWLQGLERHVESAISVDRGYETSDAEGVVCSQYNDERYMGPLSVCKFYFVVTMQVRRSSSPEDRDAYDACIQYDPDTDSFKTLDETLDTSESRNRSRKWEKRRARNSEPMYFAV